MAWIASGRKPDEQQHELLMVYWPRVRRLLVRFSRRLHNTTVDDLQGAAWEGLARSAEKYAPHQGTYWSFARKRVIGCVLDYARSMDPISRRQRRQVNDRQRAEVDYQQQHGHRPTSCTLARQLDCTPGEIDGTYRHQRSLHDQVGETTLQLLDVLSDGRRDRHVCFEHLTEGVTIANRVCLYLYYVQGAKQREIAAVMGVGQGKISAMIRAGREEIAKTLK